MRYTKLSNVAWSGRWEVACASVSKEQNRIAETKEAFGGDSERAFGGTRLVNKRPEGEAAGERHYAIRRRDDEFCS